MSAGSDVGGGGAGVADSAGAQPLVLEVSGRAVRIHVAEVGLACCAVEQQAATALLASLTPHPGWHEGSLHPHRPNEGDPHPTSDADRGVREPGAEADGESAADAGAGAGVALEVLVVSGTVTDAMAPLLVRLFERLPEPRVVVSFGACASTGGPYWDSPVVTNGIDQLLPVAAYIPGCPPRPEAFVHGLGALVGQPVEASADDAGVDA